MSLLSVTTAGGAPSVDPDPIGDLAPTGWICTIPPEDIERHGGGYPLTYVFTVPDIPGLVAQWRRRGRQWHTLPSLPASPREDGIAGVRWDSTTAYLSVPFPAGEPELHIRILEGASETGTFSHVADHYDNRSAAVVFTYDDTPTRSGLESASSAHRAARLWASLGLNFAFHRGITLVDTASGITIENLRAGVAAGYIEPANHGYAHQRAGNHTSVAHAEADILGGRDAILSRVGVPPQSRRRVHSYIYPGGDVNDFAYEAISTAGHLTARFGLSAETSVTEGEYNMEPWDPVWGFQRLQMPSISIAKGPVSGEVAELAAQKFVDSVTYAKSVGGTAHTYTYIRNWDWSEGSAWREALATVGAMSDIWSVGYGHRALYWRTRERVTVVPA